MVYVYNNKHEFIKYYETYTSAAEDLNTTRVTIGKYIDTNKVFREKFIFYSNKVMK